MLHLQLSKEGIPELTSKHSNLFLKEKITCSNLKL